MNLSPAMMSTLVTMLETKFCVDYKDCSLRALERRGLAKWYPYAKPEPWVKDGCWKLTTQGKQVAKEIAQAQAQAVA
jgi:hypothetical protein